MWNDRTKVLVGEKGIEKLKTSHVAVIGIGGVGGYACMMLVRAGVGKIKIVDFDRVDETNINRQLVATTKTVGCFKTEIMKKQISDINPECEVEVFCERLTAENLDKIISKDVDFVVDAIDSVQDKVDLICYCKENNIRIVSAMGSGNRIAIPNFKVMDVYKTSNDGLARVMRKKLKERGISKLDVVTCEEPAIKHEEKLIGSISYFPAMCGCVVSAFVVKNLLEN